MQQGEVLGFSGSWVAKSTQRKQEWPFAEAASLAFPTDLRTGSQETQVLGPGQGTATQLPPASPSTHLYGSQVFESPRK